MEVEDKEEDRAQEKEDVEQLFTKLTDICKLLKQKGEDVVVLTSKDKQVKKQEGEGFITHDVDMLTKFRQFCADQQNIQLLTASETQSSSVNTDSALTSVSNTHDIDGLPEEAEEDDVNFDIDHIEDAESDIVSSNEKHKHTIDEILINTKVTDDPTAERACKPKSDEGNLTLPRIRQSTRKRTRMNYKSFTKQEEICVLKMKKLDKDDKKDQSLVKNKESKSGIKIKIELKNIQTDSNNLTSSHPDNMEHKNSETNRNDNGEKLVVKEEMGSGSVGTKSDLEDDVKNEIKCNICATSFIHKEHLEIHLLKIANCDTFLKGVDSLQDNYLETLNIKYTDVKTKEPVSRPLKELVAGQPKFPFKCIVCGRLFSKRSNFKRHLLKHSDTLQPTCDVCGTKFKSRENAIKHRKDHDSNPFHCQLCDKQRFQTAKELEDHKINCSRPRYTVEDLTCDVCGYISKCRAALQIHKNVHLGIRPYPCEHCGKKMSSNASLERHIMSMHQDLTPFKCEICQKAFKVRDNLKKHMKRHERPQYKCEICGKTCTESGNMKKHMMTHTKEKPFVCELCGKKYSRKALLDTHRRLHTGEKPYECKEKNCGKKFRSYANLRQHIRYHSTDMPFVCDVCGKSFKQPGRMSQHRKIQHSDYGWNCLFCAEKFKSIFKYKGHLAREHPLMKAELEAKTSIRLHKCDLCGKVYAEKDDLTRHIYIHKGLKPFKCDHCFKGFNDKSNLKQHMKTHSQVHQFICEHCPETFAFKKDLNMHVCTDQQIPGEKYVIPIKSNRFRPRIVRARPVISKLNTVIPRLCFLSTDKVHTKTKDSIKQSNSVYRRPVTSSHDIKPDIKPDINPGHETKETHVIVQKEPSSNNFVFTPAQLQLFKPGDSTNRKEPHHQTNTGSTETGHHQMAPQQALVPVGPMMTVEVGLVQPCFYVNKE